MIFRIPEKVTSVSHVRAHNENCRFMLTYTLCYIGSEERSSRSQMFIEIDILENFANFTGKHLCWSLFLITL